MKVIGITGGIGTGKSTATEYLRGKGCALIDADQIGRDLTRDGEPLLDTIKEKFGCVDLNERTGKLVLNRRALADLIFNDKEKLSEYNALIHEMIISEIDRIISEHRDSNNVEFLILDAPLLYEAGLEDRCDFVVLITADIDVRIERVCKRDNATEEEIKARIKNQYDDEIKREKADYVIDNSGSTAELHEALDECLKQELA